MLGTESATGSSVQPKGERSHVTDHGPSTWATSANASPERRCWLPLQSDRPRLAAQLPTPLWCRRSAEFLGESDEKPFRPADVAEPIRVFIPDYLAYELGSALTEPLERLVYVVHGEHDAQVA